MTETTKIRMWYVKETKDAYQYSRIPPERNPQKTDLEWIPKSVIEHRTMNPQGEHILTLPDWVVRTKKL